MLESNGRLPIGLMSGTVTNYGEYDQCIAINAINDGYQFSGKYCFLYLKPPLPSDMFTPISVNGSKYENTWIDTKIVKPGRLYGKISNGICVPSVCTNSELTLLVKHGNN